MLHRLSGKGSSFLHVFQVIFMFLYTFAVIEKKFTKMSPRESFSRKLAEKLFLF